VCIRAFVAVFVLVLFHRCTADIGLARLIRPGSRIAIFLLVFIRSFGALAALAASLQAQSVREPQPDARRLQLGADSLDVFIVRQHQQQRTGTVTDRLDTVRVNGEVRLQRVYRRVDLVLGNGLDTLVDRFPDLIPRSVHSWSDGGGSEVLAWRAGRVTGMVEPPGGAKRSIDTAAAPSLYSGASFDLVLRASPLAEGYEVAALSYSGRQGARTLTAKVVGSEVIAGFGDTWRVDADFAGRSVTFWIAKGSRRLIRQIIRAAPGTEVLLMARKN